MRIGLDIGGTKTDAVLLDLDGAVLERRTRPTGTGPQAVLASAHQAVASLLDAVPGSADLLSCIGVGVPGTVRGGRVAHALNLGVADMDLGGPLAARFGVPVAVENDVKAAALGVHRALADAGRAPASLAYLNLGTGLAAGIVLGGRLLRGHGGAAGEIGHILVDPRGPIGSDGQPGGLEAMASGSGIQRQWPTDDPSPARALIQAADGGDAVALRVSRGLFDGVAAAVRVLVLSVDPEVIVIGGGLTVLRERLLDEVGSVLDGWQRTSPFLASLPLVGRLRLLDDDGPVAAVGAALLEVD